MMEASASDPQIARAYQPKVTAIESDILDAYPRLTREDILAAIEYTPDTID